MYQPWSLAELAVHLAGAQEHRHRTKMVFEFVRGYVEAPPEERAQLLMAPPPLIGHRGWDATVAALADHYCAQEGWPAPAWTNEPSRGTFPPFAPVDTPGVRTMALVHAPAAFLRHGVLMMPEDLVPV